MTLVLIVLNLVLNTYSTVITTESGKCNIQNHSEYIIVEETLI
jgi:hypothetical protein